MRKLFCTTLIVLVFAAGAFTQAAKTFPGVSAQQFEMLNAAKLVTPLPLPTWLPPGFRLEKVNMKLGSTVPIQDRELVLIYSNKLADGKTQRFSLEAGFDGIGDLPYDTTKVIRSPLGSIDLCYEPPDPDEKGKKLTRYVMTQWFNVGKTAFHYDGMYGAEEGDDSVAMISLADTEKILKSLQKY